MFRAVWCICKANKGAGLPRIGTFRPTRLLGRTGHSGMLEQNVRVEKRTPFLGAAE